VPDGHRTTKAATLGGLSGLASSERSVCPLETVNLSMWGQAGDPLRKCRPDPDQNAHAGTATGTGLHKVCAGLET